MTETAPTTTIEPGAVLNLVTGRTLTDLIEIRDTVTYNLDEARGVAEALTRGSSEEVLKALRQILSTENHIQEYPGLPGFISQAQPHHKHMPLVVAGLKADVPLWLHGEAGSGKSTTGRIAATALNLAFRSISLGPTTSKSDLLGYRDATGNYQGTGFRETYEDGGVFLFDEVDNAHPSILTLLNSSIANGHGEFPDKEVERHETTRFIATANTIGRGATAQYVGRAPIDAATIDRFAFVPMDIDDDLEESLILGTLPDETAEIDLSDGEVPEPGEWLAVVRANRQAAGELGIRTIISPRAALYGVRLASQGVGKTWLHEMLIYKGMKEQDREKLSAKAVKLSRSILRTLNVKTTGNEVVTGPATEPENADIPRADMRQYMWDLEDFARKAIEGENPDRHAFVATLAWRLEKKFNKTFVRGLGMSGLATIDQELSRATQTVDDWITATESNNWTARVAKDQLISIDDVTPMNFSKEFNYFRRRVNANCLNLGDAEIQDLRDEFGDLYGFEPGPYSLVWWEQKLRGKEGKK